MHTPQESPSRAMSLAPHEGETFLMRGERMRILADGASTGGRLLVCELTTPPGLGPPLHRHLHDDEFFTVLEGRFRFVVDGKEFFVERGAFAAAPRGSLHAFCNVGDAPGRLLIVCTPAGLEERFRAASALGDRATPEAFAKVFEGWVNIEGPPIGRG